MKYEIKGGTLPVVICTLENGETLVTEKGAMSWMSPNMVMETSGGGLKKAFGRALTGEAMFQNRYTAQGGPGLFAMASSFPGSIIPFDVAPGKEIVLQKKAFLGSEEGVTLSVHFQAGKGSGFFGGEGFIMQKCSGNGVVFGEFDGSVIEYELQAGQSLVVDTGHLAAMEASVTMEVQTVKGVKNIVFGGEGLFNTVVTGPGKIWLQTMPLPNVANIIAQYLPKQSN